MNLKNKNELIQQIKNFCLMDDDFMTTCFSDNNEAVELVLHIILDKPDIKVEKIITQYSLKNIKGRSVRLDIYATDSFGKKYNIEIQRSDSGAGAKRARYNSSLMDCDMIPAGTSLENLVDTYVIFITENDVLGKNQPIYHIERYVKEANAYFNDGSHIIYVNASYRDNTELGKLIHDFWCKNPADMNFKILADTAKYYKEEKEGIHIMCRAVEEMINKEKIEMETNYIQKLMTKKQMSFEQACDLLDIPKENYGIYKKMLNECN